MSIDIKSSATVQLYKQAEVTVPQNVIGYKAGERNKAELRPA